MGFSLAIFNENMKIKFPKEQSCVNERRNKIALSGFCLSSFFIKKFEKEKILFENEQYVICVDGIILNLQEMLNCYSCDDLAHLMIAVADKQELPLFLNKLRGNFCGIVYNKKNKNLKVFTDHFAVKTVFYYKNNDLFIVSTKVKDIVDILKYNNFKYDIDYIGSYALISYGYMYDKHTLISGIYRLKEGKILNYDNYISIYDYYKINISPQNIDVDTAIEKLDELFVKAVELQYLKNKEYGYTNYAPLSAGMDSRMTNYVLRKLSNELIVSFTYSETGEYDEIIPMQIAKELHNKWIFKSLDNGLDLFNIEESIKIADGLIYYAWPAQLNDFMKYINTDKLGVVHTGVIGDVVIGTFIKQYGKKTYQLGDGAFSQKLISKLKSFVDSDDKKAIEYEKGMLTNRAINGACLGYSTTFKLYGEDMSPFMNVDLFDFCMSLPLEFRFRHKLYYLWVLKKYPMAGKYKHNGISIYGSRSICIKRKNYRIAALKDIVWNQLKVRFQKGYGMNPVQAWYDSNSELKKNLDDYFYNNINVMDAYIDLMNDTKQLYKTGNTIEKIMAISLVGSIKMFFENKTI